MKINLELEYLELQELKLILEQQLPYITRNHDPRLTLLKKVTDKVEQIDERDCLFPSYLEKGQLY